MSQTDETDVAIVGGGVAGRAAGIFTARHGLDTVILDAGSSLLRRNAHLENYPGFPDGIDARLLLTLMREHTEVAGCRWVDTTVTRVDPGDGGFTVETDDGRWSARYVVAATKNELGPLEHLEGIEIIQRGTKGFLDVDRRGRTGVDGLYAAGRVALEPHQTVICAGHGAKVGFTILEDDDVPFYQDWVAPAGYFTGRGRDVPPGCEEIDDAERVSREERARETLLGRLDAAHPDTPQQHPSVADD